jgi:hypothetical protein
LKQRLTDLNGPLVTSRCAPVKIDESVTLYIGRAPFDKVIRLAATDDNLLCTVQSSIRSDSRYIGHRDD